MPRVTRPSVIVQMVVALGIWTTPTHAIAQRVTPKQDAKGRPAAPAPLSAAAAAAKSAADLEKARAADEAAIRLLADAFAKAYNGHDAKALASLYTSDAETVDDEGRTTQGRSDIERVFAEIFGEFPEAHISIAVKSVRFLSPGVAIEDGIATVTREPGEPGDDTRYTVVHVRQDGKWLMASVRDLTDEAPVAEDQVKALEFLIGDWVDESPDAVVETSNRWSENHRHILTEFSIRVAGQDVMSGTQRIAWDPLARVLRSWVFDSEGGFGEGVYTQSGDQWIIKMTGVTHDGKLSSATNITTFVNKDRLTWQSRDRMVGDEATPDIEEVTVVRKPPKPM